MNNRTNNTKEREHAANLPHSAELDYRMDMPEHASKATEAGDLRHYDDDTLNRDLDREEAWRNRFEHYY